jgi:hypothetical protein
MRTLLSYVFYFPVSIGAKSSDFCACKDRMSGAAEYLKDKYLGPHREGSMSTDRPFQIAMHTIGKGHPLPLSNFLNAQCTSATHPQQSKRKRKGHF